MELEIAKKIANVEVIPKGWRLGLVGEDCKICNNLRKPINEADRDAIAGIYPYYGPTGILGYINEYRLDGEYALIGEDGDHFLKYDRQPMTLLINGRNNVNNHAHIIQGTDKCSAAWFYNYFKHKDLSNVLSRQGAGRYKLNKATLEKLPILLPTPQEQNEICKMIAVWDEVIICLQKTIETKREHKRALMQRLLTGKLRFPEFAGQPWHPEKFSNLIIARDERATVNNTLPIMTSSRRGLMLQSEYFGKQVASEDTSNYKIIRKGDFTYRSMSDDRQFFFNQLDSIDAGIISPAYAVFYTHNVDDTFFKYFICSDVFSRHLDGAIQGGTRVALKLAALMSVEAKLPSLPEQRKIAAVLSAADREIDQLTQKLEAYKQQKKGLMQQLLTGKKRVNIPSSHKEKHYA